MGRIKKGDKVVVISGSDRSTEPHEVIQVVGDRVLVKDVNVRTKHLRRSQQNPKGGVSKQEFPIHISKVLLYSDKAQKGVRIHIEEKDGKKVRVGTCGTQFD